MLLRKSNILLTIISLGLLSFQITKGQYNYVVTGRAIDQNKKTVPFAQMMLLPTIPFLKQYRGGDQLIGVAVANSEGVFHYEETTSEQEVDQLLYIVPPIPPNTYSPIFPPTGNLQSFIRSYKGYPISLKKKQHLDFGSKTIVFQYGVVNVKLVDKGGKPLFTESKDWEGVGLRITNSRGQRIVENYLSSNIVSEAVRLNDSRIAIALPEGRWYVEIAPNGENSAWLSSRIIDVKQSSESLLVTLKY